MTDVPKCGRGPKRLLIVHGLNQQPRIMDTLAHDLAQVGDQIELVTLKGHGATESLSDLRHAKARDWVEGCKAALRQEPSLQTATVAYSTGALAYLCALLELRAENPSFPEPCAHILLAPALAIRTTSRLPKLLRSMPGLTLPSASPRACRRYLGTPVATYLELFQLIDILAHAAPTARPLQNPCLMAIHPKDELVDPMQSRERLEALTGGRVRVLLLNNTQGSIRPKFAHLICQREALGNAQYEHLLQQIRLSMQGLAIR